MYCAKHHIEAKSLREIIEKDYQFKHYYVPRNSQINLASFVLDEMKEKIYTAR